MCLPVNLYRNEVTASEVEGWVSVPLCCAGKQGTQGARTSVVHDHRARNQSEPVGTIECDPL